MQARNSTSSACTERPQALHKHADEPGNAAARQQSFPVGLNYVKYSPQPEANILSEIARRPYKVNKLLAYYAKCLYLNQPVALSLFRTAAKGILGADYEREHSSRLS
jgi:hypothetical protein